MIVRHPRLFIVLLLALLASGSQALAHAAALGANPKPNSVLRSPPRDVAIVFSERVQAASDSIVVQDAGGARVDQSNARSESNGRVVRATLNPLSPGTYKVIWRVRSADGHVAEGTYTFRVRP
jgi:methionine-rich copper-binding protein CopC